MSDGPKHKYLFIYKTTNLINGKIYIGQHRTNKLEDGYIGNCICKQVDAKESFPFHRAVRKYKYENFKREIIEFVEDFKQLNEREIFWIAELHTQDNSIGYNISIGGLGGDNITGHPNYKEICRKNAEFRPGRLSTEERRRKNSEANKGRKISEKSIKSWQKSYQKRPLETCPHCSFQGRNGGMKRYHFDNCKKNPNRVLQDRVRSKQMIDQQKESYYRRSLEVCPYCNYISRSDAMKRFHGENCKHKQKVA